MVVNSDESYRDSDVLVETDLSKSKRIIFGCVLTVCSRHATIVSIATAQMIYLKYWVPRTTVNLARTTENYRELPRTKRELPRTSLVKCKTSLVQGIS